MNPTERIKLQPSWVLHRRDFRDSSQIVELISREHGRLSMVARGVKRPRSRQRGLLQPFSPLLISWVSGRELATMTDVEQGTGQPLALHDDRLLSGFYINELLLKLTHRFDPQPAVFDLYGQTLVDLDSDRALGSILREFELRFLEHIGFGLNLTRDIQTGAPVAADQLYHFVVDQGPVPCEHNTPGAIVVRGSQLMAMASSDWSLPDTVRAARQILTRAIDLQLDGKPLHSRRVLRDMRRNG